MTETEKFLTAYRRLESALTNSTRHRMESVLMYENNLENKDAADRLKTCRIIRNYISHHSDGMRMFPASAMMTRFLNDLAESIENEDLTVGKLCKKALIVTDKTTLKEMAAGFSAQKGSNVYLPYEGSEGRFCIPVRVLSEMLSMDMTPARLLRQKAGDFVSSFEKEQFSTVDATEPAEKYKVLNTHYPILVLTRKDTVKGILQPGTIRKV